MSQPFLGEWEDHAVGGRVFTATLKVGPHRVGYVSANHDGDDWYLHFCLPYKKNAEARHDGRFENLELAKGGLERLTRNWFAALGSELVIT